MLSSGLNQNGISFSLTPVQRFGNWVYNLGPVVRAYLRRDEAWQSVTLYAIKKEHAKLKLTSKGERLYVKDKKQTNDMHKQKEDKTLA